MGNNLYTGTTFVSGEKPPASKLNAMDTNIENSVEMLASALAKVARNNTVISDLESVTELKVTASSPPDMLINIATGLALVSGTLCQNEASAKLSVVAPSVSNRYTICQISNEGVLSTKNSAEAGSPTEPDADADNLKLAAIYLPLNAANIANADAGEGYILDRRRLDGVENDDVSSSGTGEDDLNSFIVEADSLSTKGGLRILAAGTKTNANGNKTIKFTFGSTSVTVHAAANDTNDWRAEIDIFNTATGAQRLTWKGYNGTTLLQGYDTMAEDSTADLELKFTGECAHASDTITQTMFIVQYVW